MKVSEHSNCQKIGLYPWTDAACLLKEYTNPFGMDATKMFIKGCMYNVLYAYTEDDYSAFEKECLKKSCNLQ